MRDRQKESKRERLYFEEVEVSHLRGREREIKVSQSEGRKRYRKFFYFRNMAKARTGSLSVHA